MRLLTIQYDHLTWLTYFDLLLISLNVEVHQYHLEEFLLHFEINADQLSFPDLQFPLEYLLNDFQRHLDKLIV